MHIQRYTSLVTFINVHRSMEATGSGLYDTNLNTLSTQTPRGQELLRHIKKEWQIKNMACFSSPLVKRDLNFMCNPKLVHILTIIHMPIYRRAWEGEKTLMFRKRRYWESYITDGGIGGFVCMFNLVSARQCLLVLTGTTASRLLNYYNWSVIRGNEENIRV